MDQGLVERLKVPRKGPGRPLFDYRLYRGAEKAVSALLNPSLGLVAVSFDGLRRVCRREKMVSVRRSEVSVRLFRVN